MFVPSKKGEPLTCVIVGAGHRAECYSDYALANPDRMRIVGVADPNTFRQKKMADKYGFSPEFCFDSAEMLAKKPRFADAIINCTMDHQHVETAIPLLKAGYDMLLEKPFAVNEEEMWRLVDTARKCGSKIMVCHVLRYAPFYASIRQAILDGTLGEVIALETTEHVSYHHMSIGYVRGKWRNKKMCHASILLAKCCHDMDLTMWMMGETSPVSVASSGSNFQFTPEKMPKGAGTRCLLDCPIEPDCPYSAKKLHIDHPNRWSFYVWAGLEDRENVTIEDKIHSLKTDNPHGVCAWRCDNDTVDHQSVIVQYKNGATSNHSMVCGASKGQRSIHIVGTRGEISGVCEDGRYILRTIDNSPGHEYTETVVDVTTGANAGHGGGDLRLSADFVNYMHGERPSISCTSIEDSINGHLAVYRADESMETGKVLPMTR